MDIKQVQELVKIINKTNISEISIEEEGLKITIKQKEDAVPVIQAAPAQQTYYAAPLPAPSAPAASGDVSCKGCRGSSKSNRQLFNHKEPDDRYFLSQSIT
jgi:acetyl-CoA carboxylase biotin carboxyl carrier protein